MRRSCFWCTHSYCFYSPCSRSAGSSCERAASKRYRIPIQVARTRTHILATLKCMQCTSCPRGNKFKRALAPRAKLQKPITTCVLRGLAAASRVDGGRPRDCLIASSCRLFSLYIPLCSLPSSPRRSPPSGASFLSLGLSYRGPTRRTCDDFVMSTGCISMRHTRAGAHTPPLYSCCTPSAAHVLVSLLCCSWAAVQARRRAFFIYGRLLLYTLTHPRFPSSSFFFKAVRPFGIFSARFMILVLPYILSSGRASGEGISRRAAAGISNGRHTRRIILMLNTERRRCTIYFLYSEITLLCSWPCAGEAVIDRYIRARRAAATAAPSLIWWSNASIIES